MQDDNLGKENPSKTALTVTKTNVPADQKDSLADEMKADMMQMAVEGFMQDPAILKYINQAKPFIPMVIKQANKYFGSDKVRIMIYVDRESGAFVFEKMDMDNIDREKLDSVYTAAPAESNFLAIQKEDLDNPTELIKMLTEKFNINIF